MFKYLQTIVILAIIACASAKPGLLLGEQLAYSAPIVAAAPAAVVAAPAPYVTATSSQVFARNYNGIATAPVVAAAPVAAPVVAKYVSAPLAAPVIAKYAAAPLAAPFAYSSPLTYAAAASPVLL
ncbi:cuticle protein 16.5-like [Drosophila novamexicana]|uniref:cuticle protein 16.5-like n=1 Tax=Drosophila novamexicana TaxID=47314 RepID=UPI0011E5E032|nr:cuticle protein 16.5-like [Drosophila novamexicana]